MKRKAGTLNITNQTGNLKLGFSLNNPRRVGAHHGQAQTQTPFRGPAARGYGNGSGKGIITQSQYICADAFDIPHISVKNTRGLISTKYKWINGKSIVKKITPGYDNYLEKIKGNITKQPINTCTNNNLCYNNPTVKNLNMLNYQTYLNSIKCNLSKTTSPESKVIVNCNS